MKSTRTPGGNLRDFHIDERLPSLDHATRVPAAEPIDTPRQQIQSRQTSSPTRAADLWAESSTDFESSRSSLTDSVSSPDQELWTSWEREVGEDVDLSRPVNPTATARTPATKAAVPNPVAASPEGRTEGQARTETLPGMNPWSAELAHEERRMERSGTVDYTNQYQKQEILKVRTREFTAILQRQFREQVEIFNDTRRSPAHQVHVYKVSKSDEDFMLYRNGVKLVVSGSRAGRVVFAFNQYLGQIFAPTQAPVVEIEASWGPFDQLFWSYKGERIQLMDLVRYFFTEFVRQSFR